MSEVQVALDDRSYIIHVKQGVLSEVGPGLAEVARSKKIALVFQQTVHELYGERILDSCRQAGLTVTCHLVPDGEQAKTFEHLTRLCSEFAASRLDRAGTVVAVGGGAVGDLAGFAAASWLRGVDFVQIPTTLLAQVDASVGGKVAVNIPEGKNLVGAFWQPKAVLIDPDALATLPAADLLSGLAEVIKYGIILDADFYSFMKASRSAIVALESGAIQHAIIRSCELKAYVVTNDERESGLRAVLNFGHTFGHAVEAASKYSGVRHGEAVAIGMVLACNLAVRLGMISQGVADDVTETITAYGLPTQVNPALDVETMMAAMSVDKKAAGGQIRFVLPTAIGTVRLVDTVTPDVARDVILESMALGRVG